MKKETKSKSNKKGNTRNYAAAVADSTPSRRRASSAPSAPVSSTTDRIDRGASMEASAPVGTCRPLTTDRGAFATWSLKNGGGTFSEFLHAMSAPAGPCGEYANSIAAAVGEAVNSRSRQTRDILAAVRAYLVRTDGETVGNLLADGFAAWVTPAGFFLLTDSEIGTIRASRTLAAYVAAPVPAVDEKGVKMLPGGGAVLGSARVACSMKVTRWGRTPATMGTGAAVGKRVALSLQAWINWLKWCYNHSEALNHESIKTQYAAADSVLRYATSGRKSTRMAAAANVALAAAVDELTPEQVAALPAALRAALGL